jgi:hypothetical protein
MIMCKKFWKIQIDSNTDSNQYFWETFDVFEFESSEDIEFEEIEVLDMWARNVGYDSFNDLCQLNCSCSGEEECEICIEAWNSHQAVEIDASEAEELES